MHRNTPFLLPFLLAVLATFFLSVPAIAQTPTDSLGGKTVHVFLPSTSIDTLVIQNLNIVMTKDAPYWYSYTFTKAGLYDYQDGFYFTDPSHRQFFSHAGLGTTEAPRFLLADFAGTKEIWIIVDPSGPVNAKPVILLSAPKTVYVLNPWFTTAPKLVSGAKTQGMATVAGHCGWFSAMILDSTIKAGYFEEIANAATYGKSGLGKVDNFNLDSLFGGLGASIYLNTNTNAWTATLPPNTDQECGYLMAATARDFSLNNADFDFGSAITGDFSLVGAVNIAINTTNRHPVRSAVSGVVKGLNIFNNFDTWWNTDSTNATVANRSYESCIDIPMSKTSDGLWEYDSYRDSPTDHSFFPLEGKANRFNETMASCYVMPPPDTTNWKTGGPQRNGNFCVESHASFIYAKGQHFAFRGDDDVWVFINDKLVVDLGGIHTPKSDSVDLDKLNLTAGQSYKWDFFYCDRQPCGSSLRVKTSIYFQQQKSLYGVAIPGPTPNSKSLQIWKLTGGKGSCASIADTTLTKTPATTLSYQLLDASGNVLQTLGDSTYYTGITIKTPVVTVDTNNITGLAAGNYKIIAFEPSNQNLHVDIPFTVPVTNLVELISPAAPVTNPVGTLVRVIAENQTKTGTHASAALKYTPDIPAGLQVYQDSARTQLVVAGTQLTTDTTGYDTLWVTGTGTATTDKTYLLSVLQSTKTVSLTFTVPKNRVMFQAPLTVDTAVLSLVTLHVANIDNGVVSPKAQTFTILVPAGLQVFSDPAKTSPVLSSTQLVTDSATGLVNLYATADSSSQKDQTYVLQITGSNQVSLTFRMPPLNLPKAVSAAIYDVDGDGVGDSLAVVYDHNISASPPKQITYSWPGSAAPVTVLGSSLAGMITGTNLAYKGVLTTTVLTAGTGSFGSTYSARGIDSTQTIPISDHIGPIILTAEISLGNSYDTVIVTFSEPIGTGAITAALVDLFAFKPSQSGAVTQIAPVNVIWNADKTQASLAFDNTAPNSPRAGNLIQITDGAGHIADALGNTAGSASRFRVITGAKRTAIKTVTLMTIAPSPELIAQPSIKDSIVLTNTKIEDLVVASGRMGHLIQIDLGSFAATDDFSQINPSQVVLEYQVGYFTNTGAFVTDKKGSLACTDPLFGGDCVKNRGFLFLGWNFTSKAGAKVGTGAYVTKLHTLVKVAGKTVSAGNLVQIWGVLRGQTTALLKP